MKENELLRLAYDSISEKREIVNKDYHRLGYHIMSPVEEMKKLRTN